MKRENWFERDGQNQSYIFPVTLERMNEKEEWKDLRLVTEIEMQKYVRIIHREKWNEKVLLSSSSSSVLQRWENGIRKRKKKEVRQRKKKEIGKKKKKKRKKIRESRKKRRNK